MLALVGIPLGIATRKGGKSAAYLIALFLGFFLLLPLFHDAGERGQAENACRCRWPSGCRTWFSAWPACFFWRAWKSRATAIFCRRCRPWSRFRSPGSSPKRGKKKEAAGVPSWRIPLLPQLVDTYVLSNFLFYFVVILATFRLHVPDLQLLRLDRRHDQARISLRTMFTYLFFLTPYGIYEWRRSACWWRSWRISAMLSKQNEVTAFKACGVSLYPPGHADPAGFVPAQRRAVRVRLLLSAGRQPEAG
jgi:hypothetical protein